MSDYNNGDWVQLWFGIIAKLKKGIWFNGMRVWTAYGTESIIFEDAIRWKVTRDTQYIDKRFERIDKLSKEITHSLNEAEMLLDPLPF